MTQINVLSLTQRIVVDPFSSAVAVILAGPQGPAGPAGGESAAPVTAQTGTAYTFVLGDAQSVITHNNAGPSVFTIPENATVPFPIGTVIEIVRLGTGSLTVSPASGSVVLRSVGSNNVLGTIYQCARLRKLMTNTWILQKFAV